MRTVGTNHGGYANERNITGLPFRRHRVVRCSNVYRFTNFAYFKLRKRMHPMWGYLHWDGGMANYDLLHFFNGISLGKKPWLSTFETYLPRWAAYGAGNVEWGLSKLAGKSCKRLIALSECTRDIQRQYLQDYPDFSEVVMDKVSVLHPPQIPLLDRAAVEAKFSHLDKKGVVDLVLVGADFFRKGGLETLRALDVLLQKGLPIRLQIASTMQYGDYASKTTQADLAEAMAIIDRHPKAIQLHRGLPNSAVLDLFRKADIGLLPTWADTYGYTALEAMAAGCPVISTDIRALPEINDTATGWVIPVPKDNWGNGLLDTEAQRASFSANLLDRLIATLEAVVLNPNEIHHKSLNAYNRILDRHDPIKAADTLEKWYDDAMDNG